jgi:hypothetical protein
VERFNKKMKSSAAAKRPAPTNKEELMVCFENFDHYPRNRAKNLFARKDPKVNLAEVITEVHVFPYIFFLFIHFKSLSDS